MTLSHHQPNTAASQEPGVNEMAMDALKNLTNNIPAWQRKLDELSGQVEKRQIELAAVIAADPKAAEVRSLRKTGSTESLKPKNEGPTELGDNPADQPDSTRQETTTTTASPLQATDSAFPSPNPQDVPAQSTASPATPNTQTKEILTAVQSRARAHARPRQRSASMVSGEGAMPAYRTRSMIIVYYDSYVQGFFDDLVRFTSSSRNLMRKAKMAARVAHIKRMAEMDFGNGNNSSGDEGHELELPSLRYMSTRRMGPIAAMSRSGLDAAAGLDEQPDVYDKLDKSLEIVQSTCEHGAHQFLRDADCNDEIKRIQSRLREVLKMAQEETERVLREEPELAKQSGDAGKIRTRKPISMRRDLSALKDQSKDDLPKLEAADNPSDLPIIQAATVLEVDTNLDADEGIDMEQDLPRLQYRSTRHMRPRPIN